MILSLLFVKVVGNTMLYMIFQYGWEPVLIQRISIGFEAILENDLNLCFVLYLLFFMQIFVFPLLN